MLRTSLLTFLAELTVEGQQDAAFFDSVLLRLNVALQCSYRAFVKVEEKINEGTEYLRQSNNVLLANFISQTMWHMTDEQLDQMQQVAKLMVKQIDAIQRFRGAKIEGLNEAMKIIREAIHQPQIDA